MAALTLVLLVARTPSAKADKVPMPSPLDRAFHAMYDLDFRSAENEIAQFKSAQPSNPLGSATEAANLLFAIFEKHQVLQAEFFTANDSYLKRKPIFPDPDSVKRFQSALDQAEEHANTSLARNNSDPDALFALTLVWGLRADFAALVERRDMAALRYSNQATMWARRLLALSPDYYDAYVATGVQKYLVGLRSAPVRWLLRLGGIKGDVGEGMQELALAADKGHYLAPFARILLALAHLRKGERVEASRLLTHLRDQFPHNPLFAEEVARLQRAN